MRSRTMETLLSNKCEVDYCKRYEISCGNGLCRRHYDQMRRYGTILDIRTRTDPNRYELKDEIALIDIRNKKDEYKATCIIDRSMFEKVIVYKWTMNSNGYIRTFDKNHSPIYLHRFLLDYEGEKEIDHINRNKLDNRLNNLRIVDHALNMANQKPSTRIDKRRTKKKYIAEAKLNRKRILRKYYETPEEAIQSIIEVKKRYGIIIEQ